MADGTLNFDTKVDASGMNEGASQIGNIIKGIGIEKLLSGAIDKTVELGKKVIDTGMGFESSMSQVAATMGITTDEIANGSVQFTKLSNAAKKMGATTQFSASQSADALNYLALAGYDADTAIETLPTILNLAAAGGMELGRASDMVTDAMSALGLKTKDASGFVDKMAKTSQKSNTSVSQLGDAILTVGGSAKILKGGTTELCTSLGILADNGIKGAEGGTALRNVITSLTAPTDNAKTALDNLGIAVFDAQGNMRSMPDIIQDLGGALDNLSQEERQEVLNQIFNKADIAAVNALLGTSSERWGELTDQIDNSTDAAQNMAETMNDNLSGALTQLGSALEGLAIEIYEQFSGTLQSVVEAATGCVSQIVAAFQEGGVQGAIQAAADIVSGLVNGLTKGAPNLLTSGVGLVTQVINGITQKIPDLISGGMTIVTNLVTGIIQNLPQIVTAIGKLIIAALTLLLTSAQSFLDAGAELIESMLSGISEVIPDVISAVVEFVGNLLTTIVEKIPDFYESGLNLITAVHNGIIFLVGNVIRTVADLIKNCLEKITEKFSEFLQAGSDLMKNVKDGISNMSETVRSSAETVGKNALQAVKNLYGKFMEAGQGLIKKIAEGIKSAISKVVTAAGECIKQIKSAFDIDWSEIGKNIIEGIKNGISSMIDSLAQAAANAAQAALNAAKSMLGIHSPSTKFRYLGEMSVEGMKLGFRKSTPGMRKAIQSDINDVMNSLKTRLNFVTTSTGIGTHDITSIPERERNLAQTNDLSRLIELQQEANEKADANSRKPIYLGTDRIDRKLPKGAVPVL